MDNMPVGIITLDDIGYDVTRYQHAYIDYKSKKQNGQMIQLLFQLKNNKLDNIYSWSKYTRGVIEIADNNIHQIGIMLEDAATNKTFVSCYIRKGADSSSNSCSAKLMTATETNKFENTNILGRLRTFDFGLKFKTD